MLEFLQSTDSKRNVLRQMVVALQRNVVTVWGLGGLPRRTRRRASPETMRVRIMVLRYFTKQDFFVSWIA